MTDSTATAWEANGVSLQTLAFDIVTIGGDRIAPPPMRGSNVTVPYRPGTLWLPRQPDARQITLDMWVIGVEEDGTIPDDSAAEFHSNFRKLRNLLWNPREQIELTKKFYIDGDLIEATAKAQFVGGLNPNMSGPARGSFAVTLLLSDPYFYSAEVEEELENGNNTIEVAGDDWTYNIQFEFSGTRNNPVVVNSTLDIEMSSTENIGSGDVMSVDVYNYTSFTDPDTTPAYDSTGSITHSGSPQWFALAPGENVVNLSSDLGSGDVAMTYKAAWF